MKVQKLDDIKLKLDTQQDSFKQLKSRFLILIDNLKNLHEQHSDTVLSDELNKLLRKMSHLPPIQSISVQYLPHQASSVNRKSSRQARNPKSQLHSQMDNNSQLEGKHTGSDYNTLTDMPGSNE